VQPSELGTGLCRTRSVPHDGDGGRHTEWLEGGDQSAPVGVHATKRAGVAGVAWQYLRLGFTHIVPNGVDQLSVIATVAVLVGWWRTAPSFRPRVVVPASMTIAAVAIVWTIQRLG
jgi:hypothetical protein